MTGKSAQLDYRAMSDEALCALSQRGDKEAERHLIESFMSLVKLKARPYFLLGADRADLLQEGSIGLFSAIRDYDSSRGAGFRSYAEVCILNNIIAAVKRSTRKKHFPLNSYISLDRPISEEDEDSATLADMLGAAVESPEDIAIRTEAEQRLVRIISEKLTDFEKQVLSLFMEGKSYKQIGEETGRTAKAADNALQRVKKKVTALMKDEE